MIQTPAPGRSRSSQLCVVCAGWRLCSQQGPGTAGFCLLSLRIWVLVAGYILCFANYLLLGIFTLTRPAFHHPFASVSDAVLLLSPGSPTAAPVVFNDGVSINGLPVCANRIFGDACNGRGAVFRIAQGRRLPTGLGRMVIEDLETHHCQPEWRRRQSGVQNIKLLTKLKTPSIRDVNIAVDSFIKVIKIHSIAAASAEPGRRTSGHGSTVN